MKDMKKMIAAVMVLAVALAGVFVVIDGDEADALTESDTNASAVSSENTTISNNNQKLFVGADGKIITVSTNTGTEIYVADGVTVTIKGGSSGALVKVYAASSEKKYLGSSDTYVSLTLQNAGDSIKVKADYGSTTANSTLLISGKAVGASAITGTAGSGGTNTGNAGKVMIDSNKTLESNVVITGISYGVAVGASSTSMTYYDVAKEWTSSIALTAGTAQIVYVKDASVTVAVQYDNTTPKKTATISFVDATSDDGSIVTVGVTATATTAPTVSGTLKTGSVAVVGTGYLTSTMDASSGVKITAVSTQEIKTTSSTSGRIGSTLEGIALGDADGQLSGDLYVYGNIVLSKVSPNGGNTVTITAGSSLTSKYYVENNSNYELYMDGKLVARSVGVSLTGNTSEHTLTIAALNSGSVLEFGDVTIYKTLNITNTNPSVVLPLDATITFTTSGNIVATSTPFFVGGTLAGEQGNNKIVATVKTSSNNLAYVKQYSSNASAATSSAVTISNERTFVQAIIDGYKDIAIPDGLTLTGDNGNGVKSLTLDGVTVDASAVDSTGFTIGDGNGNNFTLSLNNSTIKGQGADAALTVKKGSSLIITESNVFMDVVVESGATVESNNNVASSNNITGNVDVGYGAELALSGSITQGLTVTVWGTLKVVEGSTLNVNALGVITTKAGSEIIVDGILNNAGSVTIYGGSTLTVNGQFNIASSNGNASLDNQGSVVINGTMNVSSSNAGMPANNLKATNDEGDSFVVNGSLIVTGTLSGVVKDKGDIVINGKIGSSATVYLYDEKTLIVTSLSGGNLTVSDFDIMKDDYAVNDTYKEGINVSDGNEIILKGANGVKGVSITEKVSSKIDGTKKYIWCDMYISGAISLVNEPAAAQSVDSIVLDTHSAEGNTVKNSRVAQIIIDDSISLGKKVKMTIDSKTVVSVKGSITVASEYSEFLNNGSITISGIVTLSDKSSTETISGTVNSVMYKVTNVKDGSSIVTYTNYADAVSVIENADEKTINVLGDVTVSEDNEVKTGTIKISGTLTVSNDAVMVLADGAKIDGITSVINVKGTFTAKNYTADVKVKTITADVVSENGNERTFTSLASALEVAGAGTVITLSGPVDVKTSITIPAETTVKSDYLISIYKNVILTVDGNLEISSKGDVEVNNKNKTEADKEGEVVVNGQVSVVADSEPTILADVSGAHYSKAVGAVTTFYVSNMDVAAENVDSKIVNGTITVKGTVNAGDLVFEEPKDLVLIIQTADVGAAGDDNKTVFTFASITLKGAQFKTVAGTTSTGTVIADASGAAASVALNKASGITLESVTVEGATSTTDYLVFNGSETGNAIAGKVTVLEGTVTLATVSGASVSGGTAKFDGKGNVLSVADDATLAIREGSILKVGSYGVNAAVIIDGTMTVVKGKVEVSGIMDVNGKISISQSGNSNGVEVTGIINVLGEVSVGSEVTKEGRLSVSNGYLTVGSKTTTLGATGAVDGIIILGINGVAKVYDGTVTKVVDTSAQELKPIVFNINGAPYMTVYSNGKSLNDIVAAEEIEIPGITTPASASIEYYSDPECKKKISGDIEFGGDVENVYVKFNASTVKGVVSSGTGLNLYIDNVLWSTYVYNGKADLTVGVHEVRFDVLANYDGSKATITFNGKTVTDGKIEITADMDTYTLVASGATPAVTPTPEPTPIQPSEKDDSMGITEYLLIILVVLAAILVIVVAIRMMRS